MILGTPHALLVTAAISQPSISDYRVDNGTCIAVYHSESSGSFFLVGVDIASGAFVQSNSMSRETTLCDKKGVVYHSRLGESGFSTVDPNTTISIDQLSDFFPFLIPSALVKIEPDRREIVINPDNTLTVVANLVIGNLGLTARGYKHPGENSDRIVRFIFDQSGKLQSIEYDGLPAQIIEYADAPHTQLAPALRRDHNKPGGMQLVSVETYIPGRPDLFEPDAILPRIHALTQQNAEEEQALVAATLATPSGKKQMQEAQRPDNGIFGWKSNRMALILTGLIVIAVGSLAWWKNRS